MQQTTRVQVEEDLSEEEYVYAEEEEEESAPLPAPPCRKRVRAAGKSVHLELQRKLKRTKSELKAALAELQKLRRRVAAIDDQNACAENIKIRSTLAVAGAHRAVMVSGPRRVVCLNQRFVTPGGRALCEVAAPYRFCEAGSFPHAIASNPRSGLREYQVEARRQTTLAFELSYADNGEAVTEQAIDVSGLIQFKMEVLYADDFAPVRAQEIARHTVESVLTPRESVASLQNMTNGVLVWKFKFNMSSNDTFPRNRAFVIRVSPASGPHQHNEELCVFTPAFTVRSKVTAPR